MSPTVTFQKTAAKGADTLVLGLYTDKKIQGLEAKLAAFVAHAVKKSAKFQAKLGETLVMSLPEKMPYARAVVLGLGDPTKLDSLKAETAGGRLFMTLKQEGARKAALQSAPAKTLKPEELAAHIALGVTLRSYSFTRYKSKKQEANKNLTHLTIITDAANKAKDIYTRQARTAKGVFLARDLVNEPPNALYPDSFAKRIKKELGALGVQVQILDEKKMKTMGMGAILAVGMGSAHKPRMVIMRWNGLKNSKTPPLGFVGKGVTFDTGGISIKPAGGMEDMKMDMGGAAAVTGLMMSLALRKAKVNAVAVVGLAENMPSGNAYRPADILKSYSGKTVEVLNTDAEGRLVLADCLTHIQKAYKPQLIVDLATLTGAMMVALGFEYCGTFANDDKLWRQLEKASADTGEKLWRMPLDEVWKKEMESPTADLQNLGHIGRYAGACTGAGFLEHFIEGKTPWAHMDIAGTAWRKSDQPTVPRFGTGFGVRVLDRFVADNYEK